MHLADHESVVVDRLRRAAADRAPYLLGYDQDRWTTHLDSARRSIAAAGELYAASRRTVIDLFTVLPAEADARVAMHSERGILTVLDLGGTWKHNQHHLEQAQAIVQGRCWQAAAT